MKKSSLMMIVAGVVALVLCIVIGCNRKTSSRVQGYVEGEFVYVASPLAGTLQNLCVQRGAQVKAGDLLYVLDSTYEKAARDQTQAALTYSEKEYSRQEKLSSTPGAFSVQDFDRARSAREQDSQKMTQAEWELAQKSPVAPRDGQIFDTLYREGEWVASGRPVVALLPPANIKVRAFVQEPQLSKIHLGDKATVRVDGVKEPYSGKISFISPQAEYTPPVIYSEETRRKLVFMVEIRFEPEVAAKLHPGQPVDVEFNF